jgi:hypothetical protein
MPKSSGESEAAGTPDFIVLYIKELLAFFFDLDPHVRLNRLLVRAFNLQSMKKATTDRP